MQAQVLQTSQSQYQETKTTHWNRLIPFVGAMLIAAVMLFANLGNYPLFNPDEGLYAEPAREMIETGEYITTLLNYTVRFTKPPLIMWAMVGCYNIFGITEFAARFFCAATGLVLIAATYCFAEKYANWRVAWFSSIILSTSVLFVGTSRMAITDMPLSFFVTGSLLAFYHAYHQSVAMRAKASRFWKWLGWTLVGLAVMTKGPVGLILPAAIMGLYHLLKRDVRAAWNFYKPISGLLLVAAISIPWFAIETAVTNGAYLREFILRENFQRFTSVVDHPYPWWYHIASIAGGMVPFCVFIPQSILGALPKMNACSQTTGSRDMQLFCVVLFAFILVFFSCSVSKLMTYTLPAFPALAILIACEFERCREKFSVRRLIIPFAIVSVGVTVACCVLPYTLINIRDVPRSLFDVMYALLLALAFAGAISIFFLSKRKFVPALATFSLATVVTAMVSGVAALDTFSRDWEEPIVDFARYAAISDWPIFIHDTRKPGVTFYVQRKVFVPENKELLLQQLKTVDHAYILTRTRSRQTFAKPEFKIIAEKGRFMLVRYIR